MSGIDSGEAPTQRTMARVAAGAQHEVELKQIDNRTQASR